jgi:ribosomal protein S13
MEFQHQIRIAGTDCRGDWLLPHALSQIRGIGYRLALLVCDKADIDKNMRCGFLTDEEVQLVEDIITNADRFDIPSWMLNRRKDIATGTDKHIVGNDLVDALRQDIERQKKIRSYRGIRHFLNLPVRGQRTKTSGRHGMTLGVAKKKSRK